MATFREVIYSALDLLKEKSDDAFYTEEHMLFLATKFRAYLLERKYKKSRNKAFQAMSGENTQQICVSLERTDLLPFGCSGSWLKSTEKIPSTLEVGELKISTINEMLHSNVTMIPAERMPYVGYNKWLRNIIYAAKGADDYLYLSSINPQFLFLKNAKLTGVFSDPAEAAAMACDDSGETIACDVLDQEFPLEAALIPSCIELMVQEIAGPRYAPEDKANNAKDDLGEVGAATTRTAAPVERTEARNRSAATEAEE